MSTEKAFLILGIVIALSTVLFGIIFVYSRTPAPQISATRSANQRVNKTKGNYQSAIAIQSDKTNSGSKNNRTRKQISEHLQKKLLILLNGDRSTATRLLNLAKTRNPDKSVDWCAEKVIFDLQRDRGRY